MALGVARTLYRKLCRYEIHFFDLSRCASDVDIVSLKHTYKPHERAVAVRRIKTMALDLTKSEGEIHDRFNKTTRNEISRATRDGITYLSHRTPTLEHIDQFLTAFRELESRKGIVPFPRDFYFRYARVGELVITRTPLSYHVYLTKYGLALLLNSVTVGTDRQAAGRANRLNHWEDIKLFRSLECTSLDLGGWAADERKEDDPRLRSIAEFKSALGAQIIPAFYQLIPMTRIGDLTIRLRNLRP